MHLLTNVTQNYAWGSRTAIAELQGRPGPSARPEAELWMGTHPAAPSQVAGRSLAELIAKDPRAMLGPRVLGQLGPDLPFLLKVLAAAEPLSLQAHPTREQARVGFDLDDQARIPLDAPHRNYKDRNHKPELLCALTEFDALCGFRRVAGTLELLADLAVPELDFVVTELRARPDAGGVRSVFTTLTGADRPTQQRLVDAVAAACRGEGGEFADEQAWVVRLAARYPGDIGVVTALLLNLVRLQPGEAIFLPAGNLHAYLGGVGVEIMASSDNVLRGGLTGKHVNVAELVRVLEFTPLDPPRIAPREQAGEVVYPTPAAEFRLGRIELGGSDWTGVPRGPEIVLCTGGQLVVRATTGRGSPELSLPRGASVFIPAATGPYALSGRGTAFRAVVP